MSNVAFFILSAGGAWLLSFPIYESLVRFNIIDQPTERSSHATPTVRGGGIAIMIAIAISGTVLFSSSQDSILFAVIAVAVVVALVSANLLPPKGTH